MRKILLLLCFACVPLAAYSPNTNTIPIAMGTPVNPYLELWEAVCQVESGNNPYAYNPLESAYGISQIRAIRLLDYYLRTGKRYSLQDCYDPEISKQVFMFYATKFQPWELEAIAKQWNGSGSMTISYWQRVKSKLNSETS